MFICVIIHESRCNREEPDKKNFISNTTCGQYSTFGMSVDMVPNEIIVHIGKIVYTYRNNDSCKPLFGRGIGLISVCDFQVFYERFEYFPLKICGSCSRVVPKCVFISFRLFYHAVSRHILYL